MCVGIKSLFYLRKIKDNICEIICKNNRRCENERINGLRAPYSNRSQISHEKFQQVPIIEFFDTSISYYSNALLSSSGKK